MHFLTRGLATLLLCMCAALPAHALEPLTVHGKYTLYVGQIPVGKVSWIVREHENGYSAYSKVRTTGIARLIKKHRREMKASGVMNVLGYIPTSYEYNSATGKKRHVELAYDEKGALIHRVNHPEDGAGRPQVPATMAKDSVDPLTALLTLREKVGHALASSTPNQVTHFNVYDGRRLTQISVSVVGTATLTDGPEPIPVYKAFVERTPIDGHSQGELEDIREEKDPPVYVYFSKDEKLMPLLIEAESPILNIRGRWQDTNA